VVLIDEIEGGSLPTGRDARKSGGPPLPPKDDELSVRLQTKGDAPEAVGGVPWASAPSATSSEGDDPESSEIVLPELLPSSLAEVADRPFDAMSDAELLELGRWLERARITWPVRPVRRVRRSNRVGTLDRRRTLAKARRTGGDPAELLWNTASQRPRKVAMIADVSGSMQTFVRPYMHVMRALTGRANAEVFAFSTEATRITAALRRNDPLDAISAASDPVDDRFTGTRIATSLRQILGHPTWSTTMRGAVVLIASDGWDTDPPEDMERQMARLSRMANRIIWVNPRAAADEFEPLVGGMAAALPFCAAMHSGHSLNAMRTVLHSLGNER
jgi:uncharacterized protein with von Willebrand factor type A (vWA) domain